ncbi:glycosyltransferase [Fusobacterium sp. THCT1E2]
MIGIVILNYKSSKLILKLLKDLEDIKEVKKIIIVDNNSQDDSVETFRKVINKKIILIENKENRGYASGNNIGIKYLINNFKKINYITILNPDIEISNKNIFIILKNFLEKNKEAGIIAPLMFLNGKYLESLISWKMPEKFDNLFNCLGITKKIENIFQRKKEKNVIPGSFLFFKKEIIENINYLDEGTFLYYEENILAQKLKKIKKKMLIVSNINYNHVHSSERKKLKNKLFHNNIYFNSMIYYEKKYNQKYSKITIPIIKILFLIRKIEIFFKSYFYDLR